MSSQNSLKDSFLCMKYIGLKFSNVFRTHDFTFLPKIIDDTSIESIPLHDAYHSCKYDKEAEFYVILNKLDNLNAHFKDKLAKFKFLEAIILFLFANRISRIFLCTIEIKNNNYIFKKAIKYSPIKETEEHTPLLWKNIILLDIFTQVLDKCFNQFIELRENWIEFVEEFSFSIETYHKGKYSENVLDIITSLWTSLEIFSTITMIYIYKTDKSLIKSNKIELFKKKIIELAPEYFNINDSNCWEPLKERFYEHIANKINTFLPINQKVRIFVESLLKADDFKFPFNLMHQNLVKFFYNSRNKIVHNGKFPKINIKALNRKRALFCMVLERLILKTLEISILGFEQYGDHEYLLMRLNNDNVLDSRNYFDNITRYIYTKIINPVVESTGGYFKNSEFNNKLINPYYANNAKCSRLVLKLNHCSDTLEEILKQNLKMNLKTKKFSNQITIKLKEILSNGILIEIIEMEKDKISSLYEAWLNEIDVQFQIINESNFILSFNGYIEKIRTDNYLIVRAIPDEYEIFFSDTT